MTRRLRIAGLIFFAIAFLLPSVRASINGSSDLPGWACALYSAMLGVGAPATLLPPYDKSLHDVIGPWLLLFSGSTSPLKVVYLLTHKSDQSPKQRRTLAVIIALGIVAAWCFLALEGYEPLIGHYLWVISIALIVVPELRTNTSTSEDAGSSSPESGIAPVLPREPEI